MYAKYPATKAVATSNASEINPESINELSLLRLANCRQPRLIRVCTRTGVCSTAAFGHFPGDWRELLPDRFLHKTKYLRL